MMKRPLLMVNRLLRLSSLTVTLLLAAVFGACSVAESKIETAANAAVVDESTSKDTVAAGKGATITIDPEGPADTVRVFYKHLREKRFREALFLTNLRPAIEGLTDSELKDFSLDLEAIAGQVPANVEINGEIITGDQATVTVNLPDNESDENDIQPIRVKRENGVWIIITADEHAAKKIKQLGKRYFYDLRIETHEEEARKMLERVSKAQLAYSLQNGGSFTDVETLIAGGLLPDDVRTSTSTGYNYSVTTAADKRSYFATATAAEYNKSGKLSFLLQLDPKGISRVSSKDNGGKPMRN